MYNKILSTIIMFIVLSCLFILFRTPITESFVVPENRKEKESFTNFIFDDEPLFYGY